MNENGWLQQLNDDAKNRMGPEEYQQVAEDTVAILKEFEDEIQFVVLTHALAVITGDTSPETALASAFVAGVFTERRKHQQDDLPEEFRGLFGEGE